MELGQCPSGGDTEIISDEEEEPKPKVARRDKGTPVVLWLIGSITDIHCFAVLNLFRTSARGKAPDAQSHRKKTQVREVQVYLLQQGLLMVFSSVIEMNCCAGFRTQVPLR